MSITKAPKQIAFDFGVKHPQLEYSPGQEPVGRKKYPLHKNMESFNFYMGKASEHGRYNEPQRTRGLFDQSLPSMGRDQSYSPAHPPKNDSAEILKLKAQLREKELKLREISESFMAISPQRPEPKRPPPLRPMAGFSPEKLYEQSIAEQSRKPVYEPIQQNRSFSVEPPRSNPSRNDPHAYTGQGGALSDLLKHPAFQQPRYTKSNPKSSVGNPITGMIQTSRSKTPDRLAHYGREIMSNSPSY